MQPSQMARHSLRLARSKITFHRPYSTVKECFLVSREVATALKDCKPVVALESTIYTHGFPYPENLDLASHLEEVVRRNGGVPATIAVMDGLAHVGIEERKLRKLLERTDRPPKKISTRDLGFTCGPGTISTNQSGGTTTAATMHLANLAGIPVLATGGLGGVHREGHDTMDISADLGAFRLSNVNVVCSGCKGFLDIPRTLEFLETQGVGVATFADGRIGEVDFPAFWSRNSGVKSPWTVRHVKEAAMAIVAHNELGLRSGMLFANPIPQSVSIPKVEMEAAIETAIEDAQRARITGPRNTPFILQRLQELTHGRTVSANKLLVEENVAQGTRLAKELSNIGFSVTTLAAERASRPYLLGVTTQPVTAPLSTTTTCNQARNKSYGSTGSDVLPDEPAVPVEVMVAGSLAIDTACDFKALPETISSLTPQIATSNPASMKQSLGGVATNVATAIHLLGSSVRLCSGVGNDLLGSSALALLLDRGLSAHGVIKVPQSCTSQYVAVNGSNKDLVFGMADMKIMQELGNEFDGFFTPQIELCRPSWLVLDANWDSSTLGRWIQRARRVGAKIAFEPVSITKSGRLFDQQAKLGTVLEKASISLCSPNKLELAAMYHTAARTGMFESDAWWDCINALNMSSSEERSRMVHMTSSDLVNQGIPQQSIQLLPYVSTLLVKLGSEGVLLTQLLRPDDPRLTDPTTASFILARGKGDDDDAMIGGLYMRLFPAVECVPPNDIISVNGVGDTFLGVLMAGLSRSNPRPIEELIDVAQQGAIMTLRHNEAVNPAVASLKSRL